MLQRKINKSNTGEKAGELYGCVDDNLNDVAKESARRHKEGNPDFEGQIIDMRVGVHSGRVIYGIVGSKRYKFDVYSQG